MSNLVKQEGFIYEDNKLINACYEMGAVENRLVALIVSKINNKEIKTVDFTLSELLNALKISITNRDYIKKIINSINGHMVKLKDELKPNKEIYCTWFNKISIEDGIYTFSIYEELIPYLYNLNKDNRYTVTSYEIISEFEQKYTARIYKLMKQMQEVRVGSEYNTGTGIRNCRIEELKEILITDPNSIYHSNTGKFMQNIVNPAIGEINSSSDIEVSVTNKKRGKIITNLIFTIKPNPNYKKPTSEVAQKPLQEVKPVNNTPIVKQEVKTPIKASEPIKQVNSSLIDKLGFIPEQYLNMPETNIDELTKKFRTMRDILMNLKNPTQQIALQNYVNELQSRII